MICILSAGANPHEVNGPGTYLLLMHLARPFAARIGPHGHVTLPPGCYVYVGSAQGPGGIAARVGRHLRAQKRQRWHVDLLTVASATTSITDVLYVVSEERLECKWVRRLLTLPGAEAPVPGFGSSDCREACPAHLLRLRSDQTGRDLAGLLEG